MYFCVTIECPFLLTCSSDSLSLPPFSNLDFFSSGLSWMIQRHRDAKTIHNHRDTRNKSFPLSPLGLSVCFMAFLFPVQGCLRLWLLRFLARSLTDEWTEHNSSCSHPVHLRSAICWPGERRGGYLSLHWEKSPRRAESIPRCLLFPASLRPSLFWFSLSLHPPRTRTDKINANARNWKIRDGQRRNHACKERRALLVSTGCFPCTVDILHVCLFSTKIETGRLPYIARKQINRIDRNRQTNPRISHTWKHLFSHRRMTIRME